MQDDARPTVLVVDDAADMRQLLNEALKPTCVVLLAKNGEQALDRALNKQPDLILLDVMMPGMNGFEVLSKLQADPATRDIPVIFLTGMDTDRDVERGLHHGAVDYIRKPFVAEIVVARVTQHVGRSRQTRQLHRSLAYSDVATGLPNRAGLLEKITVETRRAVRVGGTWTLCLADVRHVERPLLLPQYDALMRGMAEVCSERLTEFVPWAARASRHRLALVLPEAGIDRLGGLPARLGVAVAEAANRAGMDSIDFRLTLETWKPQQEDGEWFLTAAETRLDTGSWLKAERDC